MPDSRITLQNVIQPVGYPMSPACDTTFNGSGTPLPNNLLFDYIHDVAAHKRWGGGQGMATMMRQYYEDVWESVPLPSYSLSSSGSDNDTDDLDDQPRRNSGRRHHHRTDMSEEMLDAMVQVMLLSMLMKGRTPQSIAAEQERREQQSLSRAKEESQAKVQLWMQGFVCHLCTDFLLESVDFDH